MPSLVSCAVTALALAGASPEATAPRRPREPSPAEWVERFYVEPRLDLLPRMIVLLDRQGVLEQADRFRHVGFFAALFQRADVQGPLLVNTSMVGPGGRTTLVEALWLSGNADAAQRIARSRGLDVGPWKRRPPDLRRQRIDSPGALQVSWGAFLASGDLAHPRRVIDVLDRRDPGGHAREPWLFLVRLARESLVSHARTHEPVMRLLREEARARTGPARPAVEGLLVGLDAASAARAERMTRVVYRNAAADVRSGSRAARPFTLYRLGDRFGRLEEEPDGAMESQLLLVVAQPDVWELNVARGIGRHVWDPGPEYMFRAPVVAPRRGERTPGIELGRELEWLRAHGATRETRLVAGVRSDVWTARADGCAVTVLADPGTDRPRRVTVKREGRTLAEVEILDYERDLPPRLELFAPPAGIRLGAP